MAKTEKFKKIKPVSMVDQVSDSIKELIVSGEMRSGDRLPSEAELAESYGVNRLTVRMALQKLSVLGFVETRVGEGSFVTEFKLENVLKEIPAALFLTASNEEFYQLRKILETESVKAGMTKATEEDLTELKRLCDALEVDKDEFLNHFDERSLALRAEMDYAFHYQLVVCGHNQLFIRLYQLMAPFFKSCMYSNLNVRAELSLSQGLQPANGSTIHHDLYCAFVQKDWEACQRLFDQMMDMDIYWQKTEQA